MFKNVLGPALVAICGALVCTGSVHAGTESQAGTAFDMRGFVEFNAAMNDGPSTSFTGVGHEQLFGEAQFRAMPNGPDPTGAPAASDRVRATFDGGGFLNHVFESNGALVYSNVISSDTASFDVRSVGGPSGVLQMDTGIPEDFGSTTLQATGVYGYTHGVLSAGDAGAQITGSGTGSIVLDVSGAAANSSGFQLGGAGPSGDAAQMTASGSGAFTLEGAAPDTLRGFGATLSGSANQPATLQLDATFDRGAHIDGFQLVGAN